MNTLGIVVVAGLVGCTGPTFEAVVSADPATIAGIDRGVLFVDAKWSLPSSRARRALEERIEDLPIELVIADIDRSPALVSMPALENKLSGSGESIWISGGAICYVCTHPDCLEDGVASVLPRSPAAYLRSSC